MREDTKREADTRFEGAVIGYESDVSPYRKEIRVRAAALFGSYNPHTGKTYDRSGKVISNSGDIRASLIPMAKE